MADTGKSASKTTAKGDVMNPGSRQNIANDAHERGQREGAKIDRDQAPRTSEPNSGR